MKRVPIPGVAALAGLLLLTATSAQAATQSDYCYTPPGVADSLKPNIMVVMDSSGSMYNFAYDFPDSDDNGLNDLTSEDDGDDTYDDDELVNSTGYDPNTEYVGYFDSDANYTYSSSKFYVNSDGEWDGNFLNWLTMRRVDVLRGILVGGRYNATSNNLVAEPPDSKLRGSVKKVSNPSNYTPFSGDGHFRVYLSGGAAFSYIETQDDGTEEKQSYDGNTDFKINVHAEEEPSGLVKKYYDKARFGLAPFSPATSSEDGDFKVSGADISGEGKPINPANNDSFSDFGNAIENAALDSATPLAEALYTVAGYFAQAESVSDMPELSSGPSPQYGDNLYPTNIGGKKDPFYFPDEDATAACAQSFVLYVTDGAPTRDGEIPEALQDYDGDGQLASDGSYLPDHDDFPVAGNAWGSGYFDDVALYARTNDLRDDLSGGQSLMLYPVFVFGKADQLVKEAAINGGFKDLDGNNEPYYDPDSCALNQDNSDASDLCDEWDEDRDGSPDTFFQAKNPIDLQETLDEAIAAILERTSSGSTVATISTQTRSGGELLQAYYLPKQTELGESGSKPIYWKGFLRSLWTDPASNIREDRYQDDQLKLKEDRILQFHFNEGEQRTEAWLFPDDNGDNVPDTCDVSSSEVTTRDSTNVSALWAAGEQLAYRDPDSRQIWFNSGDDAMTEFVTANASVLEPYWQPEISSTETEDLIKYLRGFDNPNGNTSFRYRQADDETTTDYGDDPQSTGEDVWKLGAVITSTPQVLRPGAVSDFADANGTHKDYYTSDTVTGRASMAFVGANDGMLHAFYTGDVEPNTTDSSVTADLEDEASTKKAGKEAWAFIPENALPYLRWYGELDATCHVPTVDYRTKLVDVATDGDWKTVLIGTMGFGGRSIGCDLDGDGTDETLSSSIFVLDVTDPENPQLMWERSYDPDDATLTLTNTVIAHKDNDLSNGRNLTDGSWYLIAGSGPENVAGAGPNDPASTAFTADPSLYVFDLGDGTLKQRMKLTDPDRFVADEDLASSPGVALGELITLDPDEDDITDSVMFGTYSAPGGGNGKLYRLQMTSANPSNWQLREAAVIPATTESNDIAGRPFFAAPGAAEDPKGSLWVYGATGRYHDVADNDVSEDPQFMFGYIEDCWGDGVHDSNDEGGTDTKCQDPGPVTVQDLGRTDEITVKGEGSGVGCRCGSTEYSSANYDSGTYSCPDGSEKVITDVKAVSYNNCPTDLDCTSESTLRSSVRSKGGWYWQIPAPERVFSKPFVRGGLVNVLSFAPEQDLCSFGGDTIAYAVDYQTGAAPPMPIFLASGGFSGDMGEVGTISTGLNLGKGVPPIGEGFAAMPSTEEGEVGAITQTSTGQVTSTQQQTEVLDTGLLFLRAP